MNKFLIVGAGLSGAVIARSIAEAGHKVDVMDSRNHLAGNCHTERCAKTGVLVHVYGPHIFHTSDKEIWDYVNRFATFIPYRHQVKVTIKDHVYSLPINLLTINQFFGKSMSPGEARKFIDSLRDKSITEASNFEQQALSMVGSEIYKNFFEGYTKKQWGCDPSQLPASILQRLPLRFNYDDNYFFHAYQGIPESGYTHLVEKILDHNLIDIHLSTSFNENLHGNYDHIFYSGSLDSFFSYKLGELGYRTLDFEMGISSDDFQGCAVMNYGDYEVPYTRITEHKYFAPWENHESTVYYREFSRQATISDIPFYPIRLASEKQLLKKYVELANETKNITFVGRLGTYRYLDMDISIREALNVSKIFLESYSLGRKPPVFSSSPI